MLVQGSFDSVVDNEELEHITLKQVMKKKGKEMTVYFGACK